MDVAEESDAPATDLELLVTHLSASGPARTSRRTAWRADMPLGPPQNIHAENRMVATLQAPGTTVIGTTAHAICLVLQYRRSTHIIPAASTVLPASDEKGRLPSVSGAQLRGSVRNNGSRSAGTASDEVRS